MRLSCCAALVAVLLSACAIQDLDDNIDEMNQNYGYLKALVEGNDEHADVLFVLVHDVDGQHKVEELRTVRFNEPFYALVLRGDYTLVAFEDINGDFAYQPGEPAASIHDPTINWFIDMLDQERVDHDSLAVQNVELSADTVLERDYDLSLEAVQELTRGASNFLRIVTWDEPSFSDENVHLGMWQPKVFEETVGFGLYLLDEFDPAKESVVLVHGINDSPKIFRELAQAIPADHQVLLFHYPSSFPLEYTSYVLTELLDELVQRNAIPRIDVIAHSMGGLVSKGMIYQANPDVRSRLRTFVSIASPFGGHSAAAQGIKWSPVIAPVWWAMAPGSEYLETIGSLDLSDGPQHYLIYSYAHERGGEQKKDDGVVTVESQLIPSSRDRAAAVHGIADNHTGVMRNEETMRLLGEILSE